MNCIFCKAQNAGSLEHIVPESLGNTLYILSEGVCGICNNRFSKFEQKALGQTILGFERSRLAAPTKKGKPGKAEVEGVQFVGSGEKNIVTLNGLKSEDITDFDPHTGIFKVRTKGFDKSEVATSKLLLKMGLESIFKSRRDIFDRYDFTDLCQYLTSQNQIIWPFITTKDDFVNYKSLIKREHAVKREFTQYGIRILVSEIDKSTLIFRFTYAGFRANINLLNRSTEWIDEYLNRRYENAPGVYNRKVESGMDIHIVDTDNG